MFYLGFGLLVPQVTNMIKLDGTELTKFTVETLITALSKRQGVRGLSAVSNHAGSGEGGLGK